MIFKLAIDAERRRDDLLSGSGRRAVSISDAEEADSNGPLASTRTTLTLKPRVAARTVTGLAEKFKREKQVSCTRREVNLRHRFARKGAARMNEVGAVAKRKTERSRRRCASRRVNIAFPKTSQFEFRAAIVRRIIVFNMVRAEQ